MLIFGFKPYHNYHSNITKKIISQLKENDILKKELFEVKFNEKMFKDAIVRHKPSIIIGLGQCSTGKKIRIERKAINEKRENVNGVPKPILKGGPKTSPVNLKIPSDNHSWISYYAWDYVCNFAMYQIIRYIKEKNIKKSLSSRGTFGCKRNRKISRHRELQKQAILLCSRTPCPEGQGFNVRDIKFGFIHIPYNYNEKRFLSYVKKLIKRYTK